MLLLVMGVDCEGLVEEGLSDETEGCHRLIRGSVHDILDLSVGSNVIEES